MDTRKLAESGYVCSRVLRFLLLKRWTLCVCCVCEHVEMSVSENLDLRSFLTLPSLRRQHYTFSYLNIFVAIRIFSTTTEESLMHSINFIFSLFLLTYLHLLLETYFLLFPSLLIWWLLYFCRPFYTSHILKLQEIN